MANLVENLERHHIHFLALTSTVNTVQSESGCLHEEDPTREPTRGRGVSPETG